MFSVLAGLIRSVIVFLIFLAIVLALTWYTISLLIFLGNVLGLERETKPLEDMRSNFAIRVRNAFRKTIGKE